MRGPVPSLGALSGFSQQSCSRIPHLKLHILARHSSPKSKVLPDRNLSLPRRCVHAATPSYSLSEFFKINEHVEQLQDSRSTAPSTAAAKDLGVEETLEHILQEAHPERVLYTLLWTTEGRRFVAQTSAENFAAAFCSVDPHYLIEPFKDVYQYMKPSLESQPRYRWVRAIEERLISFAEQLDEVVDLRDNAGHQLTKDVCNHLLHCARVLGHGEMARQVWQRTIPENGLQRDVDLHAYNCYMEGICWSNAFSKAEQWRLRVTPRILKIRQTVHPPPDLSGYRTGRLGLRHETLVTFRRMVGQNIEGDEETFTNLMVAMGREGDLSGAKSILKSVYNIDVDLLLEVDEEEVETPTFYEKDSPLRPTARLLFTIAHVFSSNNEIGLAFKLVDFVSRQYDLRIPFNVWMHLLNWAFVLSVRRSGVHKSQGQDMGQIPGSVIDALWREMTDEPHNVKPDIVMHIYMAQSCRDRGLLRESLTSIHLAKDLFELSRGEALRLGKDLIALTDQILTNRPSNPLQILPTKWLNLRRQFILTSLTEDRDLQLLITTIRRTFTEPTWPEHGRYRGWERRRLPTLIADFTEYLPNTLAYKTRGGLIEITGLKSDRERVAKEKMGVSRWIGLLRAHVDRDIATVQDLLVMRQSFRTEVEEIERTDEMYARSGGE